MAAVLLYAEFIAIECATTLCLLGNRSTYHTYHSKYLLSIFTGSLALFRAEPFSYH